MADFRSNDPFFQYDGEDRSTREMAKRRYTNLSPEHVDRAFNYQKNDILNEDEILDCLELADDEWHEYNQLLNDRAATPENVNRIKEDFREGLYEVIDDPAATRFYNDMLKTNETLKAENQDLIDNINYR